MIQWLEVNGIQIVLTFLFCPLFITIYSLHDRSDSSQWCFLAIWIMSCIYLALNLDKYGPNHSCKDFACLPTSRSCNFVSSLGLVTWSCHLVLSLGLVIWSHHLVSSLGLVTWSCHLVLPLGLATWCCHLVSSLGTWSYHLGLSLCKVMQSSHVF